MCKPGAPLRGAEHPASDKRGGGRIALRGEPRESGAENIAESLLRSNRHVVHDPRQFVDFARELTIGLLLKVLEQ
jgi:hypothetical protein